MYNRIRIIYFRKVHAKSSNQFPNSIQSDLKCVSVCHVNICIASSGLKLLIEGLSSFTSSRLFNVELLSLVLLLVFISFICENVVSQETEVGGIAPRMSITDIII